MKVPWAEWTLYDLAFSHFVGKSPGETLGQVKRPLDCPCCCLLSRHQCQCIACTFCSISIYLVDWDVQMCGDCDMDWVLPVFCVRRWIEVRNWFKCLLNWQQNGFFNFVLNVYIQSDALSAHNFSHKTNNFTFFWQQVAPAGKLIFSLYLFLYSVF